MFLAARKAGRGSCDELVEDVEGDGSAELSVDACGAAEGSPGGLSYRDGLSAAVAGEGDTGGGHCPGSVGRSEECSCSGGPA